MAAKSVWIGQPPPSPVNLLNPRPTHPLADFFPWLFFGVSRYHKGSSKTPLDYFYKKYMSHVENFFQQKTTKVLMSFFARFFCFVAFLGASQQWEFKNTKTNVLQKNRTEKFIAIQKSRPKKN
jgi:hypothetical protein